MEANHFFVLLGIPEKRREKITRTVLYAVFQSYAATADGKPVDTSAIAAHVLEHFRGPELVAAAYVFANLEQEVHTGENFDLLEQLRAYAIMQFATDTITPEQFEQICQELTHDYLASGHIPSD